MYYLHDTHVAHLDLKSDNILVSSTIIRGKKDIYSYHAFKLIDYSTFNIEVYSKSKLLKE